jgi:hypothetical protein
LLLYLVSSFFSCLFSEMMKYLHIACHLAAKFRTFFAQLILEVVFIWMGDILMWSFSFIFVSISANFII